MFIKRAIFHADREIHDRLLSPRQRVRAGAALAVAVDEINHRLKSGEAPRADDFIDNKSGRAPAVELLEGVLLRASVEYEEKKVPLLGRLYASLVFDSSVAPPFANMLLRLAERLTYHQIIWLSFFASDRFDAALEVRQRERESGKGLRFEAIADLDDLGFMGVLGIRQPDGRVANLLGVYGGGTFDTVELTLLRIAPTHIGAALVRLMRLDDVDQGDLIEAARELELPSARL